MSGSLKGRRSEEMTQSNTSSMRVGSTFRVPEEVMAIKVPQNEEISGGGKNGGREGVGYAIVREERIGRVQTLRNERRSCLEK